MFKSKMRMCQKRGLPFTTIFLSMFPALFLTLFLALFLLPAVAFSNLSSPPTAFSLQTSSGNIIWLKNPEKVQLEGIKSTGDENLFIYEIYPSPSPSFRDEYIILFNRGKERVSLSSWFFTIDPESDPENARKITFPWRISSIGPGEKVIISKNVQDFEKSFGRKPDFCWGKQSCAGVIPLEESGRFVLPDAGGSLALKNKWNETVDFVCWGKEIKDDFYSPYWKGKPLDLPGKGYVLQREFLDSNNRSANWRILKLSTSNFKPNHITFTGKIVAFVSPDCSYEIFTRELKNARESIHLNVYSFTHPGIAEAIGKARDRGVEVFILKEDSIPGGMDDLERKILNWLYGKGCKIVLQSGDVFSINHAKYCLIDGKTVILSSANLGYNGIPEDAVSGNREWGLVLHSVETANYFMKVFHHDSRYSVPFSLSEFYDPSIACNLSLNSLKYDLDAGLPAFKTSHQSSSKVEYTPMFRPCEFDGTFPIIPVLSPDNSLDAVQNLLESADNEILLLNLYFYENLGRRKNPVLTELLKAKERGVEVKVLLNYNPQYSRRGHDTNDENLNIVTQLKESGVDARLISTEKAPFANLHAKGIIVDSSKVFISSINLNENGFLKNREAGIIVDDEEIAQYYRKVYLHDWNLADEMEKNEIFKFIAEIMILFFTGILIFRKLKIPHH